MPVIRKKNYNRIFHMVIIAMIVIMFLIIINTTQTQAHSVNWEQVRKSNNRVLEYRPDDVKANFEYSIALANLGLIEEAYEHFELIEDEISLGKFNRKIHPIIKDLEVSSSNILLLNYAAFSSSINSKHEQSIPFFKRILELEPENIWIRNFMAATYIELENFEKAKKEVDTAIEIKDNKYSHLVLAYIYYETGHLIKAFVELGRSGDLANRILFD